MHGQLIGSLQYWRFWRWHEKRQRKFQVNHIIFTYVFISISNIQAPHLALVPLPRVRIPRWWPTMSITHAFYLSSLSDCSYNVILIRVDASDDDMKASKVHLGILCLYTSCIDMLSQIQYYQSTMSMCYIQRQAVQGYWPCWRWCVSVKLSIIFVY